jgi:hypothetical protein
MKSQRKVIFFTAILMATSTVSSSAFAKAQDEPNPAYASVAKYSIEHRWKFLISSLSASLSFQGLGPPFSKRIYSTGLTSTLVVERCHLGTTNATALKAEQIVREQATRFAEEYEHQLKQHDLLRYLTTFVGGGGPRFWFSASPQGQQLNYAQILIESATMR